MTETTFPQLPVRTEQRRRHRREEKATYRNYGSGASMRQAEDISRFVPSAGEGSDQYGYQARSTQDNSPTRGYFNVQHNFANTPVIHQNVAPQSWMEKEGGNTFMGPTQPRIDTSNTQFSGFSHMNMDQSWAFSNSGGSDDTPISGLSEFHFGSFGSANSMLASPTTASSANSEGYMMPLDSTMLEGPQNVGDLSGLILSGDYYKIGLTFDPTSPGALSNTSPVSPDLLNFDESEMVEFSSTSPELSYGNVYPANGGQYSSTATVLYSPQNTRAETPPHPTPIPWNSETAQESDFQANANSGENTFEPWMGHTFHYHVEGENFLNEQSLPQIFGPEAPSPATESDQDWFKIGSSCGASSYAASSYGSPAHSHASLKSHPPSPIPAQSLALPPVRTAITKNKAKQGRQGGLTAMQKKEAREVRDAKACWACHISKTKCSPCSPGRPCEQCDRLKGKRRFCLFNCFNDPLESLQKFFIPDYLMGHFTKANVESFVTQNAKSWGKQQMTVKMTWGYHRALEADVVALALKENSQMAVAHATVYTNGPSKPTLVRKSSPPLGIPLAAMDEMGDIYAKYVQEIVQNDLAEYVPVAYTDQESRLPERLLAAVCKFYIAGHEQDNESEILRRAIEMHITSVILERSLILSPHSLQTIQSHLHTSYPPRTAPRLAQRQIKLAFFFLQRARIYNILEDWSKMMWSTSKDNEWAVSFSVFLVLILVMDKTIGSAYWFCEGRIKNHNKEEQRERKAFAELIRLMQTELFERCKEIFHWKFKTRKGGKEAFNPIRDGVSAFEGKRKMLDYGEVQLVQDLRSVVEDYETDIKCHHIATHNGVSEYTNAGRLACIFLNDFVSR